MTDHDGPKDSSDQSLRDSELHATLSAIEQRVIALEGQSRSNNQINPTENLEKDIRDGEVWLIGINAGVFILQIVIACIYYGQLTQMRDATVAATRSANYAADSSELADGGFERNMRQIIRQTASARDAANAATSAFQYRPRESAFRSASLCGSKSQFHDGVQAAHE